MSIPIGHVQFSAADHASDGKLASVAVDFQEIQALEAELLIPASVLKGLSQGLSVRSSGHVSVLPVETLGYVREHGQVFAARDADGRLVAYHHGLLPPLDGGLLPQFDVDDVAFERRCTRKEFERSQLSTWTVWRTGVEPNWQGKGSGLAFALKSIGLQIAIARGCTHLTCNVADFNAVSLSMNTAVGLEIVGSRKQPHWIDSQFGRIPIRWHVLFGQVEPVLAAMQAKLIRCGWSISRLEEAASVMLLDSEIKSGNSNEPSLRAPA